MGAGGGGWWCKMLNKFNDYKGPHFIQFNYCFYWQRVKVHNIDLYRKMKFSFSF